MSDTVLEVANLSFAYSSTRDRKPSDNGAAPQKSWVLRDVSLILNAGEIVCLLGPSGCGKTTLLRMLAGLDSTTSGELSVASAGVGRPENAMVFQGDSLFPWMTVYDNAAYGLRMRNLAERQISEIVEGYLEKTGLAASRDRYPHQLSGGMRQRVSIARAFANDPDVLLMDEPFSALDEQNKTLLQEELLRIWEADRKTVVFITHSVDEAVTLGDRIMVMTAGPGRVKAIVDVNLPRPRKVLELRHLRVELPPLSARILHTLDNAKNLPKRMSLQYAACVPMPTAGSCPRDIRAATACTWLL